MNTVPKWVVDFLGKRVVLTERVGDFPRGRTGVLVSVQAGLDMHCRPSGDRYATVAFETGDMWEENVPFSSLRPMDCQR